MSDKKDNALAQSGTKGSQGRKAQYKCPHDPPCSHSNITISSMGTLPASYIGRRKDVFRSAIYELIKDFPWICFRGTPCLPNAFLLNKQLTLPNSRVAHLKTRVVAAMTKGGEDDAAAIEARCGLVYQVSCVSGFMNRLNTMPETSRLRYTQSWDLKKRVRISMVSAEGLIYYLQRVFRNKIWLNYRASLYTEQPEDSKGYSDSDSESDSESGSGNDCEEQQADEKRPVRIPAVVDPHSIEDINITRLMQIFDNAVLFDARHLRYLVEDLIGFYNHRYKGPMPLNTEDIEFHLSKHKLANDDANRIGVVSRARPFDDPELSADSPRYYQIVTTTLPQGEADYVVSKRTRKTKKQKPADESQRVTKKQKPSSSSVRSRASQPFSTKPNPKPDSGVMILIPRRKERMPEGSGASV